VTFSNFYGPPILLRNIVTIFVWLYVVLISVIGRIELLQTVDISKDYALIVLHTWEIGMGHTKSPQSVTVFNSRCLESAPNYWHSRTLPGLTDCLSVGIFRPRTQATDYFFLPKSRIWAPISTSFRWMYSQGLWEHKKRRTHKGESPLRWSASWLGELISVHSRREMCINWDVLSAP
jgi:hypothetical protein